VIVNFRHKGLRLFFEKDDGRKLPTELLPRIRLILATLDASDGPEGMDNPIFRLHPLKGNRHGHWAVTVRANWRITFRFEAGQAHDVDFADYH
jgi:proteic killer suppression protein